MNSSRLRITLGVVLAVTAVACGGSDDGASPTEPEAPPNYAGVWEGQTSANRSVRMVVNNSGGIDSLSIMVRLTLGFATCTGPMVLQSPTSITGSSFSATVVFPGSNVTSAVTGTFSSEAAMTGTYQGYSGGFALGCGTRFNIGTGNLLSDGTFNATKN